MAQQQIHEIDLSPFLRDGDDAPSVTTPDDSEEKRLVVEAVRRSWTETGFLLVHHDIKREVMDAVYEGSRRYFALPADKKAAINDKMSRETREEHGVRW